MDFLCNAVNVVTHFSSFFCYIFVVSSEKPNLLGFFFWLGFFVCFLVIFCLLHSLCRNQAPSTCVKLALLLFLTSRHTHLRTSVNRRYSWSPGRVFVCHCHSSSGKEIEEGLGQDCRKYRGENWATWASCWGHSDYRGKLEFYGLLLCYMKK